MPTEQRGRDRYNKGFGYVEFHSVEDAVRAFSH
jgi:hypothetical protein